MKLLWVFLCLSCVLFGVWPVAHVSAQGEGQSAPDFRASDAAKIEAEIKQLLN